jgi:hypothetical protein
MIYRIGAQPWNGPIPPWMPMLPPLPTPVPPLPPPWPVAADMMQPVPVYKEFIAQEPRTYTVEMKSLEGNGDESMPITICPKLMVPEGHGCMVSFDGQEAVLNKCVAGCPNVEAPGHSGGMVQVQLVGERDGKVHLDLNVQQTEVEKTGADGLQVLSHSLHVVRSVPLGKATRLVLNRGCGSAPTRWLEVTVGRSEVAPVPTRTACSGAPCCPGCCTAERLPPPQQGCCEECGPAGVDVVFDVVAEVLSQLAGCFCPYSEEQEQVGMPYDIYLQHPPQCMPTKGRDCPQTYERVVGEAVPVGYPAMPYSPCASAPMPRECPLCATTMPMALPCPCMPAAPVQLCAATVQARTPPAVRVKVSEGGSRLEICCGGGVQMACKKMDLNLADAPWKLAAVEGQVGLKSPHVQACANEFTTDQKDLVVLKGKVRLCYTKDGKSAEVFADRVEINFTDGTFKIKP